MRRIDLHIHTTASDGTISPEGVVALAADQNLSAIAVTDHDTVRGFPEAWEAGRKAGVEVLPGIELSTRFKGHVHILGYFIDPEDPELLQQLRKFVEDRDVRNEKIVSFMRQDGIPVTYDQMKERFGEVVGRPHFAEILVENGLATDPTDAFNRYLNRGREYWFPRTTIPLERSIQLIVHAGGIPVLAHPFEYRYEEKSLAELIEKCISYGIRGLECRHSSHSPGQMVYLEHLADEYGLLKTGGSDFHGAVKPGISVGTGRGLVSVPELWLEELKKERDRIR